MRQIDLWNLALDLSLNTAHSELAPVGTPSPEEFKDKTAEEIYEILLARTEEEEE